MELSDVARPYVRAIFSLTSKRDVIYKNWYELLKVGAILIKKAEILALVKTPKLAKNEKQNIFIELLAKTLEYKITFEQINFINLLIRNRRLEALPAMSVLFNALLKSSGQKKIFDIRTPYRLSDAQKSALKIKLSQRTNMDVYLNITEDKKILGGVIIKEGDKVIDGSIKSRLEQFGYSLSIY